MQQRTQQNSNLLDIISSLDDILSLENKYLLSESKLKKIVEYLLKKKEWNKAIDISEYAFQKYSSNVNFLIQKVEILTLQNRIEDASIDLDRINALFPENVSAKLLKAKIELHLDKSHDALLTINDCKVFAKSSDLSNIFYSEALIYDAMNENDLMYMALKKSLQHDINNSKSFSLFWDTTNVTRKYFESIEFFKSLISKDPYNFKCWYFLGQTYSHLAEYDLAIEALEYSFITKPDFEDGYLDCAELCIQVRDFQKALDIYLEVNERFDSDEDILLNIGICNYNIGELNSAKFYLYKALKSNAYNDEIYYFLGECYRKERNFENALKSYQKALSIDDSIENYHLSVAKTYYELGNFKNANRHYKKCTKLAPEESFYWAHYAKFLLKTKKVNLAKTLIEEAEKYTVGNDLNYCKVVAYLLTDEEKGLNFLEDALQDSHDMHQIIFDIEPELALNEKLIAMVNYYIED